MPLIRSGNLSLWSDTQLTAGSRWQEDINAALRSADAAILLVSAHFLASEFIARHELPSLFEAARHRGLLVFWLAVSHSLFKQTEISQYEVLNNPERPLDTLTLAKVWVELGRAAERIQHALLRQRSATHEPSVPVHPPVSTNARTKYPANITGKGHPVKQFRIAVIPKGETLFFWKYIQIGVRQAEQDIRSISVEWNDDFPEMDATNQEAAVYECLQRGVDGICLAAIHGDEVRHSVKRATAAGIPVLLFDSGLSDETDTIGCIASDNYFAGQLAAHKLAELVGYDGRVLMIKYKQGSRSTTDRESGFVDAIKNYQGIQVVGSEVRVTCDPASLDKASRRLVERYGPEISGVLCTLEFSTLAMLQALKDANLAKRPAIIGFDTNPKIADGFSAGHIDSLILQDPVRMGYLTVKGMASHLLSASSQRNYISAKTEIAVATQKNMHLPRIQKLLYPWSHDGRS